MADPKQLASLLSEEEELRRFNAAQGDQPWYSKALPMEGRATFLPFRDTMEGSVFNKRELALPGILAGAVNAFTSPARALTGSDPTFKPGEEAANMALNTFGGGIATGKALANPTGLGGKDLAMNAFNIEKTDASNIFGQGAQQIRYTDPNSGGFIKVVQKPDGTASVLGLEVPKEFQGTGVGKKLQAQIMADFPTMEGQVSSKAAAKNAYNLGRRPIGNPNASLKDVLKMIDEDTSVNLVSPNMQKLRTPTTRKELFQQEFDKLEK